MAESGLGVGPSLIDVTSVPLASLAQLDSDLLSKMLSRLMPQVPGPDDSSCGGSNSRIWQNY
jgi:hypothetical protein